MIDTETPKKDKSQCIAVAAAIKMFKMSHESIIAPMNA
jgi:hypothetical protein